MSSLGILNRVELISENNNIERISVSDLNNARKYDPLYNVVDEENNISTDDIIKIFKTIDVKATSERIIALRTKFEILSEYPVERNKPGGAVKKDQNLNDENIDENVDISNHVCKPKEKSKDEKNLEKAKIAVKWSKLLEMYMKC